MTNANKVIREAMGLCWHERGEKDSYGEVVCSCGGWWPEHDCLNQDYTDPVNYCELMDWMRGKEWDVKVKGLSIFEQDKYTFDLAGWFELSRQSQVNLIAEAIEAGVLK